MFYQLGHLYEAGHRLEQSLERAEQTRLARVADAASRQQESERRRPNRMELEYQLTMSKLAMHHAGIKIPEMRRHVYVHEEQ